MVDRHRGVYMSASPLLFTYNNPGSLKLNNIFVDASGSPLPGSSGTQLYILQSPNLNLQGVTLTLQGYTNIVIPTSTKTSPTSLQVNNVTVIASIGTNTIGTISYSRQNQNPIPATYTLKVPKISSYVSSASGIFVNYLFGNVITQTDATTGNRVISIYSAT